MFLNLVGFHRYANSTGLQKVKNNFGGWGGSRLTRALPFGSVEVAVRDYRAWHVSESASPGLI